MFKIQVVTKIFKIQDIQDEIFVVVNEINGQFPLRGIRKKHCNFQIVGGKSTVTYHFTTGFYGLTVMPLNSNNY